MSIGNVGIGNALGGNKDGIITMMLMEVLVLNDVGIDGRICIIELLSSLE
jgi:hypothetical protein